MYSLLVPSTSPSCPSLRMHLPLFPSYFSLPEWGRIYLWLLSCSLPLWSPWTDLSPLSSSLALLHIPPYSSFYRIPLYSMMTCHVVLISHCRCTFSLHLFYAIQGILSRPSLTLRISLESWAYLHNPLRMLHLFVSTSLSWIYTRLYFIDKYLWCNKRISIPSSPSYLGEGLTHYLQDFPPKDQT